MLKYVKCLMTSLLMLTILACATCPTVKYDLPQVQKEPQAKSVVIDKNDQTGEKGYWMNRPDAEVNLQHRNHLYSIIDQLKAYWEKTSK